MEIIFIIDIFITEIHSSLILNLISTFVLYYSMEGPGGSMSEEVVFPNNTYKPAPIRRRFASALLITKRVQVAFPWSMVLSVFFHH
jgi:hypothetical protein